MSRDVKGCQEMSGISSDVMGRQGTGEEGVGLGITRNDRGCQGMPGYSKLPSSGDQSNQEDQ